MTTATLCRVGVCLCEHHLSKTLSMQGMPTRTNMDQFTFASACPLKADAALPATRPQSGCNVFPDILHHGSSPKASPIKWIDDYVQICQGDQRANIGNQILQSRENFPRPPWFRFTPVPPTH